MVRFRPPVRTFPAVSDGKAMFAFPSPALMQTASSAAIADRGSGMGRPAEFHAAVDGKRRVNRTALPSIGFGAVRPLIIAATILFRTLIPLSARYAQSGPFAGM